jgi:putative transposase
MFFETKNPRAARSFQLIFIFLFYLLN